MSLANKSKGKLDPESILIIDIPLREEGNISFTQENSNNAELSNNNFIHHSTSPIMHTY